jgi:hypothetical protein
VLQGPGPATLPWVAFGLVIAALFVVVSSRATTFAPTLFRLKTLVELVEEKIEVQGPACPIRR